MGLIDGLALGAVGGGGVGELDVFAGVAGGDGALASPLTTTFTRTLKVVAPEAQGAVSVDGGDGPGVAVGDVEVAVVQPGGYQVADPEPFARVGDEPDGGVGLPGGEPVVSGRRVERGDLLLGVRNDKTVDMGEGVEPFYLGGMEDDL